MTAFCQLGNDPVHARSWAMGNSVVALGGNHSFFYNPAGIAIHSKNQIAASFYAPSDLPRLATLGLQAQYSLKGFQIAGGIDHFGDRLYQENKLGLAIAKKLDRVALGLKVSYLNASVENISSRGTPVTEFGIMANVHPKVNIGLHAFNLTGAKLFISQNIPTVLRLGGSFSPIAQVAVNAEIERVFNEYYTFKGGLEYFIRPFLAIRSGINSKLQTNHFGLGYQNTKWQIDIAVHTHPSLGISNHFTLTKNFGSNED